MQDEHAKFMFSLLNPVTFNQANSGVTLLTQPMLFLLIRNVAVSIPDDTYDTQWNSNFSSFYFYSQNYLSIHYFATSLVKYTRIKYWWINNASLRSVSSVGNPQQASTGFTSGSLAGFYSGRVAAIHLLYLFDISCEVSKGLTKCWDSKVHLVILSKFYESVISGHYLFFFLAGVGGGWISRFQHRTWINQIWQSFIVLIATSVHSLDSCKFYF